MNQIFSIKSAAILFVATLAMCFAEQSANAQYYGKGYGGFSRGFSSSNFNRGFSSSGFRGSGFNGGFNSGFNSFGRGISVNYYRPSYSRSFYGSRGRGFSPSYSRYYRGGRRY